MLPPQRFSPFGFRPGVMIEGNTGHTVGKKLADPTGAVKGCSRDGPDGLPHCGVYGGGALGDIPRHGSSEPIGFENAHVVCEVH